MHICERPYLSLFECLFTSNRYDKTIPPMCDTKIFTIMSPARVCVEHPLDFRPLFLIPHRLKAFNPPDLQNVVQLLLFETSLRECEAGVSVPYNVIEFHDKYLLVPHPPRAQQTILLFQQDGAGLHV